MTNTELLEQVADDVRQMKIALLGDKELGIEGRVPAVERRVTRIEKAGLSAILIAIGLLVGAKTKDVISIITSLGMYIQRWLT